MPEHLQALSTRTQLIPNPYRFFWRAAPAADARPCREQEQEPRQQVQELARGEPSGRAFDGAPEGQELAPAQALEQGRGRGLRMSCNLLILRQARALHAHRRQAQKVPASRHQEQRKEGN